MAQAQFSDLPQGATVIHAPGASYADLPPGAQVLHDPGQIQQPADVNSIPAGHVAMTDTQGQLQAVPKEQAGQKVQQGWKVGPPSQQSLGQPSPDKKAPGFLSSFAQTVSGMIPDVSGPTPGNIASMVAGASSDFAISAEKAREEAEAAKASPTVGGKVAHGIGAAGYGASAVLAPVGGGAMRNAGENIATPGHRAEGFGEAAGILAPFAVHAAKSSGAGQILSRVADKGTDLAANTLSSAGDMLKNPGETLADLGTKAGRKVGVMRGKPAPAPAATPNVEKVPSMFEGDVEPVLNGGMDLFNVEPRESAPYRVGPGVITPEETGTQVPSANTRSDTTSSTILPDNQGVIVLPAARRVTYDPQTGEARTQFLTSVDQSAAQNRAGSLFANSEADSQLLNDPRGALARFVQNEPMTGLEDPFSATNPSPFSNPIRPQSTLPPWATEVLNYERMDPRHLFEMDDEHDFNMYQQQQAIQRWMNAHNVPPDPYLSKQPLTTSQPVEQGDLSDILQKSIDQANAKKNGPGLMVGSAAGAAADTDLFQKAKAQLGPDASVSEVAQLAQKMKTEANGASSNGSGPGLMKNASERGNGTAQERRGPNRVDPLSPSGARIMTLRAQMRQATDPAERAAFQEAIDREIAISEGKQVAPLTPQAVTENLPAEQPREYQPPDFKPKGGAGLSADKPIAAKDLKPGDGGFVPIGDLNLDPKRFQYKTQGIGEGGVNNSLKGQPFNQRLAGVIAVWEDPADGKTYVVNGHHRFDLAKETGQPTMRVMKLDAANAKEARAQGAIINIAEGRGTAYDAGRFFQDSGYGPEQLQKEGVSMSEGKVRDGLALSKLDPSILDKVGSGQIPEQRAIAIGDATSDPAQQEAILKLVDKQEAKGRKVTNDTVSELSRFVKNSGNRTIEQGGLFGDNQEIHSLALDKAELSAYIKQQLSKEKRVFGAVSDQGKAEILGRVKDQSIKSGENAKISQQAAQSLELYDKLSTTAGPVNDILEQVARDKANGYLKPEEARSKAYEGIREELRKALPGGTGEGGAGSEARP